MHACLEHLRFNKGDWYFILMFEKIFVHQLINNLEGCAGIKIMFKELNLKVLVNWITSPNPIYLIKWSFEFYNE